MTLPSMMVEVVHPGVLVTALLTDVCQHLLMGRVPVSPQHFCRGKCPPALLAFMVASIVNQSFMLLELAVVGKNVLA